MSVKSNQDWAKKNTYDLARWSKSVKERDEYYCLACGKKESKENGDKPFHAHHIVPKGVNRDLALDINNGVTLCSSCHISNRKYAWHKLFKDTEGNRVLFASWLHTVRRINGVKSRADEYLDRFYRGLVISGLVLSMGLVGLLLAFVD